MATNGIATKQEDGYYTLIGDPQQRPHYRVVSRAAPVLKNLSDLDVPGIRAVSDSVVFVPEQSLTEQNQAAFSNRAVYLDRHALGDMSVTTNQVIAQQAITNSTSTSTSTSTQETKPCVRIDPCPDPPFKDLQCCNNASPIVLDGANGNIPILPPSDLPPYPSHPMRDYDHEDSSWSFMTDPKRPWDRIAMMMMGISVAVAILAILALLIWSMITGGVKAVAESVTSAFTPAFASAAAPSAPKF